MPAYKIDACIRLVSPRVWLGPITSEAVIYYFVLILCAPCILFNAHFNHTKPLQRRAFSVVGPTTSME